MAQQLRSQRFEEFDYGPKMNLREYGSIFPPQLDSTLIKEAGIPIGIFVAKGDRTVLPSDSRWLRDQLGNSLIFYKEINGGHITFNIGKNMDWFSKDAMEMIRKYNV